MKTFSSLRYVTSQSFSRRISSMQKSIACHQFNLMKDKHTINLILISSKWLILFFGVCYWGINSRSKCFHLFFSGVQFPQPFCRNLHLNHCKALVLFFFSFISISSSFCHRSSLWWFFMIYFIPQEFIKYHSILSS